ncbi:hypothetical protein H0266_18330 [Halobacillus locisalis]|uniref:Uncharacterized protein n=1 Tax=Halobacillus locisalis TaxID=220753 RepID=A0A838CY13_9BACI|nr:hypothetical protein [Halobacillus locisalis]MBA2176840.1 hypothetical protein [Halobacillus locisalis]
MALLEGKSEQEVIESFRKKSGSAYKRHPAERLTRHQLSLLGYPKIDWIGNRKYDYELYKAYREKIYLEWKHYVQRQKVFAYKQLFVGLISGSLKEAIEKIEELERELHESFKDELLEILFQDSKEEQYVELEEVAVEMAGITHPYNTLLIKH